MPDTLFVALYSVEKMKEEKNKKWLWATVLTMVPVLLTEPFVSAVFGIFYLAYFMVELIIGLFKCKPALNIFKNKSIKYLFLAGFLSLIISLFLYWIPELILRGWQNSGNLIGFTLNGYFVGKTNVDVMNGGIIYGIKDFIFSPVANKIDQAVGMGSIIFVLLVLSIVLFFGRIKKEGIEKNKYLIISLVWLVVSVLGAEANAFPYKFLPYRFWVFLAIPIAVISSFGAISLYDLIKKRKFICYSIFSAIFIGIIITSGYPKYELETGSSWPPGVGWSYVGQVFGYINLKKLPPNTLVYSLCQNPKSVIGMDKMDYPWIKEIEDYKNYAVFDSLDNNYSFLKKHNYSYLILDVGCINQFGTKNIDMINKKIGQINNSKNFKFISQLSNNGFFIYKIL